MKTIHLADLFCGAGGTSSGGIEAIELLGHSPRLTAVNHWPVAIDTHTLNHPGARHLCTAVDDINPRVLYKPGELDVLWASPECTHHSNARGGKPINEQSRATAWCVPRWMEAVRPGTVLVENVPEFAKWGQKKDGKTFKAWFESCCSMGYRGEWRVLCAADYGDPTTRQRLFVQFVRGRRKIVWPEPTHAEIPTGKLRPWVPARAIIDWNIPGQSIYERKKSLAVKTLRRTFTGFLKQIDGLGLELAPVGPAEFRLQKKDVPKNGKTVALKRRVEAFLICMEHGGRVRGIDKPMPVVTTARGGAIGIVEPYLLKLRGTNSSAAITKPSPAVTASGNHLAVVEPFLVQVAHGNGTDENGDLRRSRALGIPFPVVCGERGEWALIEPSLLPQHQGGALRPVSRPAPTVATDGAIAFVEPFLVNYFGNGKPLPIGKPLPAATTKDRFALVRVVLVICGDRYLLDFRFRMLQPKELARAQGFHPLYKFTGNKTEQVKQIGNAVPRNLARALVLAALGQRSDVAKLMRAAA